MYTFISISGCSIFALPYVWFFLLITQYFDHVVASTRASTLFHLSPEILSSSIWNSYPLIFPNYFESRCWVSKASPGECNLFQHGPSLKAWFKPMNSFLLSLLGTALIHTHTHTQSVFMGIVGRILRWHTGFHSLPPCTLPHDPRTVHLMGFTPMIRLCHKTYLTWRKEDDLGGPDLITWAL